MKQWKSVDEILDFAIEREEAAAAFYADLAKKVKTLGMGPVFEQYAREEIGHKQKLQNVKKSGKLELEAQKIMDLKIGDYLVDVKADGELTYPQALIVAMKREKAAFKFYNNIAGSIDDPDLRNLFLFLAQEEAKHKLRFEIEYDDQIMQEG